MIKSLLFILMLLIVTSANAQNNDVAIDSNGNLTTGANASANLEVIGASAETAITGISFDYGGTGVSGAHYTGGGPLESAGLLGSDQTGVYGYGQTWAGYFQGNVRIENNLTVDGTIINSGLDVTYVNEGQIGSITSSMIMDSTVGTADIDFNYADSATKGGAALDLDCTACVSLSELDFVPGDGHSLDSDGGIFNDVVYVDPGGNVNINLPTSTDLTVTGVIESTSGGFKFPDGSVMSTAPAPPSQVPRLNTLSTLDSTGNVGDEAAIALGADGIPVVVYDDRTANVLKLARCNDAYCLSSSVTIIDYIDSVNGFSGAFVTIGTDGLPVISYLDNSSNLKTAKCLNQSCSSTAINIIDSSGSARGQTAIVTGLDGNPVIGYHLTGLTDTLAIAKCSDSSCSTTTSYTLDINYNINGLSLALDFQGRPLISYSCELSGGTVELRIVHCGNTTCTSGNIITTLKSSSGSDTFGNTSLIMGVDGLPVLTYLAYFSGPNASWVIAGLKCGDIDCATGNTDFIVNGNSWGYASITVQDDGFPVVAYSDSNTGKLEFRKCMSMDCLQVVENTIDTSSALFHPAAVTIGTDGLPVIAYRDTTAYDLKVAKCANVFCLNNWTRR